MKMLTGFANGKSTNNRFQDGAAVDTFFDAQETRGPTKYLF